MESTVRFYEPSDGVHTLLLIPAFLVALISAVVLGYVYNLILFFMPLIYVNFLVVVGYGMVLGVVARLLVRLSHCRSNRSKIILAVVTVAVALYLAWAGYLVMLANDGVPPFGTYLSDLRWAILPGNVLELMQILYQEGSWQVGGVPFNGILLLLVWLFEFGILVAIPILQVHKQDAYPYSENQSKWYPKYTLRQDFGHVPSAQQFLRQLLDEPVNAIENLDIGDAWRNSKVHLYFLPEEQRQYLTVEKRMVEGLGKGRATIIPIITNLAIDRVTAEQILHHFPHKRERLEII